MTEAGDPILKILTANVERDWFVLLGLEPPGLDPLRRCVLASTFETDLARAYRKTSLSCHPDRVKDERARQAFEMVNAAYRVLRDGETRVRVVGAFAIGTHSRASNIACNPQGEYLREYAVRLEEQEEKGRLARPQGTAESARVEADRIRAAEALRRQEAQDLQHSVREQVSRNRAGCHRMGCVASSLTPAHADGPAAAHGPRPGPLCPSAGGAGEAARGPGGRGPTRCIPCCRGRQRGGRASSCSRPEAGRGASWIGGGRECGSSAG